MSTRTLEFGPLRIGYDDRVLEPRPWTFAQSRWAADLLDDAPPGPVLELCSGAGQIGLATALLTGRDLVLVDASEAACELSARNAADAGLGDRVEVRHGPMDEVLAGHERFALVLADPPYIPSADTGTFPEDPLTAIDGGGDGLDLARLCLSVAAAHLDAGGDVLLQLRDLAQADQLAAELRDGSGGPLEPVDARAVDGRGALLRLRRA
ncbi:MAG TPA: class I SAM-dependent methyltransferase [Nocardioides sp.]|nr:class I SAM-dependent methyltransferase [Nocardioides sp.]